MPKLTILGSGSAVLRERRKSSCHLLEMGEKLILLDCGQGITNIVKTAYDLQKIDHIFISHPHVDHLGNLIATLQSMLVSGMYYAETKRTKTLYLHGYEGFTKDYETLRAVMFPERTEPYKIVVLEGPQAAGDFEGLQIKYTEINHNPHLFRAASYRLEHEGKSIVYSGDCGFDERLVKLSQNADVGLFEMANSPKRGTTPNHLTAFECGKIAAAAVKKLILVHWYDDTPQPELITEVRKNFSGEIIIPEDLDVIEF